MFLHGALNERFFDDFRPQVHDSEGLLMATGNGEWIWRPLNNPTRLRISAYQDNNPRASACCSATAVSTITRIWKRTIKAGPASGSSAGRLGQGFGAIDRNPQQRERYDNIAAFWTPEKPVEAGQQLEYNYRLSFFLNLPNLSPNAEPWPAGSAPAARVNSIPRAGGL